MDRFGVTIEGRLVRIELQLDSIELALARIEEALLSVQTTGDQAMAEIDDLVEQVQSVRGVEDSATKLIMGLVDKVNQLVQNATELSDLKTKVQQATAEIRQNAQPLADAVAANAES